MEDAPPLTGNPAKVIRAELDAISELIVRADVPVGIALSGGLDSSAIAAMTSRKYPGRMQAFSVGYHGRRQHDERDDAKAFAESLGMPFHQVELRSEDLAAFFPELVFWLDDPIGDISAYGYYSVMRAAKAQGVSVMLQGHGGDELFWGYPWVREAVRQTERKLRSPRFHEYVELTLPAYWSPWGIKEWIKSAAGLRSAWMLSRRDRLSAKEQAVFYDLTPDFALAREHMTTLYEPAFAKQLSPGQPFSLFTRDRPWPPLDVLLTQLICRTYLEENGIAQGDRLSMASSVELRLPLVDYRLVETVIGLRKVCPDHALPPKAWFREAIKDLVPDCVLKRPKRGFTPPLQEWHQALFAAHGAQLDGGYLVSAGILRPSSGRALAKGPYPPEAGAPISFKALTLELWSQHMATASRDVALDRQILHSTTAHAMFA
jgi:asparagine synthase (glutamine-hydrolysing)